ncbi:MULTISPECIES: hypothetical protein [Pseudomonas]|uniref:Uncharacterized protein n=1 Tax=Pseudomonas quercus TaxID=2722792 RepID=A0ABX0YJE2_9PSED|nr:MULTISPECIES: hypothetical protein [Pseudomonas]MBF7144977.1 hypothetical protein [Pseudomonas sp. LY10J]NJP03586.1 hypothetical protein [Pseudomonas quercus]
MGLKDLVRKPDQVEVSARATEEAAEAFIAGAPLSAKPKIKLKRKKAPTFVRTTFSLSKDINIKIDKMTLMPSEFKVTRSDVVRAAIIAMRKLGKAEIIALLEATSKAEPLVSRDPDEEYD